MQIEDVFIIKSPFHNWQVITTSLPRNTAWAWVLSNAPDAIMAGTKNAQEPTVAARRTFGDSSFDWLPHYGVVVEKGEYTTIVVVNTGEGFVLLKQSH